MTSPVQKAPWRWLPRLSLSGKILGMAAALLAILAAESHFTSKRISAVAYELVDLSDFLIPIERALVEARLLTIQEEALYERLFAGASASRPDAFQTEALAVSGQIAARLKKARELAESGFHHVAHKEDVRAFAILQASLGEIARNEKSYRDLILETAAHWRREDAAALSALDGVIARRRAALNDQLRIINREMESYTQSSSAQVAQHERRSLVRTASLFAAASLFGLLFAAIVATHLSRSLRGLIAGAETVVRGDLAVSVQPRTRDEIGSLAETFNRCVAALRKKEIIQSTFGQFLDPRIIEGLVHRVDAMPLNGQTTRATVFCSDVAAFSEISETLSPTGLVRVMNEYLTLCGNPIIQDQGVIAEYVGDAIVAFWAEPFAAGDQQALHACRAALAQFDRLAVLKRRLPDLLGVQTGIPEVRIRIGIATDTAVLGSFGSDRFKCFGVVGAAKRIAERLEAMNKSYGTRILISEATRRAAGDAVETRRVDYVREAGREAPTPVYELLCLRGEWDAEAKAARDLYERALECARRARWVEAGKTIANYRERAPGDLAAERLAERIERLAQAAAPRALEIWPHALNASRETSLQTEEPAP